MGSRLSERGGDDTLGWLVLLMGFGQGVLTGVGMEGGLGCWVLDIWFFSRQLMALLVCKGIAQHGTYSIHSTYCTVGTTSVLYTVRERIIV